MTTTFVKRQTSILPTRWDDEVEDDSLNCIITDMIARIRDTHPAEEDLCVNDRELNVWEDAQERY